MARTLNSTLNNLGSVILTALVLGSLGLGWNSITADIQDNKQDIAKLSDKIDAAMVRMEARDIEFNRKFESMNIEHNRKFDKLTDLIYNVSERVAVVETKR